MDGLIIAEPYISAILRGEKTWEMRSRPTHKRGRIALIRKGSGSIVGYATLVNCLSPIEPNEFDQHFAKHRVSNDVAKQPGFKWYVPWVLENVEALDKPLPYQHKSGAVTWVSLGEDTNSEPVANKSSCTRATKRPAHKASFAFESRRNGRVAEWRTMVALALILIFMACTLIAIIYVPIAFLRWSVNWSFLIWTMVIGGVSGGLICVFDPRFELSKT